MNYQEETKIKTKNSAPEEEIDLSKLFTAIGRGITNFFKGLFRLFFLFIDTLLSNLKLVTGLVIAGALLGLITFYSTRPFYSSHMTLSSDYFRGELLDNSIQNLDKLCSEGNAKVLASLLKISPGKAGKLRSIQVSPIISQNYKMLLDMYNKDENGKGKLDSLILYNNQSNFQLNVEVYDTTALRGLDSVLVNYIKSNEYVRKRIEADRANLVDLRNKLRRESGSLDTLKRSIAASLRTGGEAGRNGANNVILGERSVNPIDVYKEDLSIYNQRQEIDRRLAISSEIEIIEKFIPYGEPTSGTLMKNIVKGTIAGLVLGLLYVTFQILRNGLTRLRYSLEEV